MARRRPERREDDAPRERRRPPVAAAGEEAADAADGERHQPRRDERVEQLARRAACHPRDDARRGERRRDAARGREPAGPERAASPVEEGEERVSTGQGRRRDGRHGDQHPRRLARTANGEQRTRAHAEDDGEPVQRDGDLGAAEDDAERGVHTPGSKPRAGREAAGGGVPKTNAATVYFKAYRAGGAARAASAAGRPLVPDLVPRERAAGVTAGYRAGRLGSVVLAVRRRGADLGAHEEGGQAELAVPDR